MSIDEYEPQEMGESVYIIWSMSYDWTPEGDPNGHPINFDKVNPMGTYRTMEEAQKALMELEADDESWAEDSDFSGGVVCIYWVWRETAMMSREITTPLGYVPNPKRDQWGNILGTHSRNVNTKMIGADVETLDTVYTCSVCHKTPVDAEAGFDTCIECLRKI